MMWRYTPAPDSLRYCDRHIFCDSDTYTPLFGLRVLKLKKENVWAIRWGQSTVNRHEMPPETPLEEVQAVAIALWRMK